jgi:hypothetical protein
MVPRRGTPPPVSGYSANFAMKLSEKSGDARNGALEDTEGAPFGPFRPRNTGQIHARSVARTPFQTVSRGSHGEDDSSTPPPRSGGATLEEEKNRAASEGQRPLADNGAGEDAEAAPDPDPRSGLARALASLPDSERRVPRMRFGPGDALRDAPFGPGAGTPAYDPKRGGRRP